jgi:hypothetical protein
MPPQGVVIVPRKLKVAVGLFVAWSLLRGLIDEGSLSVTATEVLILVCLLEASESTRVRLLIVCAVYAVGFVGAAGFAVASAGAEAGALAALAHAIFGAGIAAYGLWCYAQPDVRGWLAYRRSGDAHAEALRNDGSA